MYDDQAASPLFNMPGEIRELIYAFALTFRYSDFKFTSRPFHVFCGSDEAGGPGAAFSSRPPPALMLTCRRAHGELEARVAGEAVLRACMFEHGRRIGLAVHGGPLRVPPRLRRLVFHVAMEHANWNAWVGLLAHVLGRAGALRELVVDWGPRRSPRPAAAAAGARVGFLATHEERMERRLFEALAGARGLERLWIHGDIPAHWAGELGRVLDERVRMVCIKEGWWVEDWESGISV